MKYIRLAILFLIVVCHISCKQHPNGRSKEDIKSETKSTVSSNGPITMVRNVKKGRNGTVLIAASFGGVFRYDFSQPKRQVFTNLTSKLGPRRFWDVLASIDGENKKVTGNLTIKGITHPVNFLAKTGINGRTVEANGKLVIDRSKWDVRYKSAKFYNLLANQTISDSIELEVKIVAKK